MATTTTNFGWDIPQSTDLVKDGATAIAALGQDIDTAFVDFKGGTTGQVLKKSSATDLDVEWGTASSGLTLINTTSFSAVASQSFNNVFSASYNYYRIIGSVIGSTGLNIAVRLRVAGADNSAAEYRRQILTVGSTTVEGTRTTGDTSWPGALGDVTTTDRNYCMLEIANPFISANTTALRTNSDSSSGNINLNQVAFGINNTASYTGFTAIASTGNMTGTISVYGFNL
jgi:hypothetical protein